MRVDRLLALTIVILLATASQAAQGSDTRESKQVVVNRNAYFGDLHLHTSFSYDAYIGVGTRVTPDQAYRYARGIPITTAGHEFKRPWPLDFLAVTDHPENLGLGQRSVGEPSSPDAEHRILEAYKRPFDPAASARAWQEEITAANRNYRPGKFTTFIAYEWASQRSDAANESSSQIHRGVIFAGARAPAPFTTFDSKRPEDLWTYLEANRGHGIDCLAIANHPNRSHGLTYELHDSEGRAIDKAYASRRSNNEPLSEIFQTTGSSESSQSLSPEDRFADFESWLAGNKLEPGSSVRKAYGQGLEVGARLDVNPFQFGVVGTSDLHSGLSVSDPDAFGNAMYVLQPSAFPEVLISSSPGLTGVWAENNTRAAIFAALRRREVFATSGSRLQIRFFGGWSLCPSMFQEASWASSAYREAVPMGSRLRSPAKPSSAGPRFVVWASKDPAGPDLERIQLIKIWECDGGSREKVIDVVSADQIRGSGTPELEGTWQDTEFDARRSAVYYLRVLEVPSRRWSTLLAQKENLALPKGMPVEEQQRGWSSPIWFIPESGDR
jgi:hypothetical protein